MINPMDLTGKTILITGASDGIGKATSILTSQLGAKVVMLARNEEKLQNVEATLESKGHKWYSYDLKDIAGIEELIRRLVDENGAFDGFVHCAGIGKARPLPMLRYENLHEIMSINFYAFIEIVRCITKKNFFNPGGSIVGVSSISSIKGYKSKISYNASKAAMDSAIRCISLELAVKETRINSIMPGWVKTEMYKKYIDRSESTEDKNENITRQCLGLVEPYEIANVIAFLLSDATKRITGTSILIDGGLLQG